MLLLMRRAGETLVIGDEVAVTVVDIMEDQVMIGINAPEKVPVHREEIYDRIQADAALEERHELN